MFIRISGFADRGLIRPRPLGVFSDLHLHALIIFFFSFVLLNLVHLLIMYLLLYLFFIFLAPKKQKAAPPAGECLHATTALTMSDTNMGMGI